MSISFFEYNEQRAVVLLLMRHYDHACYWKRRRDKSGHGRVYHKLPFVTATGTEKVLDSIKNRDLVTVSDINTDEEKITCNNIGRYIIKKDLHIDTLCESLREISYRTETGVDFYLLECVLLMCKKIGALEEFLCYSDGTVYTFFRNKYT